MIGNNIGHMGFELFCADLVKPFQNPDEKLW